MTVNVQFFGICTHISPHALPSRRTDWAHRVVLVNAAHPGSFDPHRPHLRVAPHVARLQLLASDLIDSPQQTSWLPFTHNDGTTIEWNLDGVFLKIGNASPTLGAPPDVPTCIPSLKHYVEQPETIGPLGPRAYEPNRAGTAAFFDFDPAPLAGKELEPGGAAVGVMTVRAENPVLEIRSFDGETIQFPLGPDAEISVSNIPEDRTADKDDDFLLHYLILEKFPAHVKSPHEKIHCKQKLHTRNLPIHIGDLSTPGCSNSGYP